MMFLLNACMVVLGLMAVATLAWLAWVIIILGRVITDYNHFN